MALTDQQPEVDTLAHLEERIQKAVGLVIQLRKEKETILQEKAGLVKELAETQAAWEESQASNQKLTGELEALHSERQQVRSRLEKLLGHIDQLGTS